MKDELVVAYDFQEFDEKAMAIYELKLKKIGAEVQGQNDRHRS